MHFVSNEIKYWDPFLSKVCRNQPKDHKEGHFFTVKVHLQVRVYRLESEFSKLFSAIRKPEREGRSGVVSV